MTVKKGEEISRANLSRLRLAAQATGRTVDEMLTYILDTWVAPGAEQSTGTGWSVPPTHQTGAAAATGDRRVRVFAIYQKTRVEALFDPATGSVEGISEPIDGMGFSSPSGAAREVITALNPRINNPSRNGTTFWRVEDTGEDLRSITNDRP